MTLLTDLTKVVSDFATEGWGAIPNAWVIPTADDLTFGNTAERMNVTVLYADLHRSTQMVDELPDTRAAEYYKSFLHCAAKIIKRNAGEIEAYDGDRVMAIFVGENQADNAVLAAFEINFAVSHIINPMFARSYGALHRRLQHTVGIDCGRVLVAKTGVRVDSDLVWVGAAANYAAKLNSFDGLDTDYPTRITLEVFNQLTAVNTRDRDGQLMWEGPYNNLKHHHCRSHYMRTFT